MFEKFLTANAGDFQTRYQGTYGFYSRDGKKVLVRLANVDRENGVVSFVNEDNAAFTLRADAADDVGFEFIPPKTCWHNTKNGAYLVRRLAQRQFQRGISDSNTGITQEIDGVFVGAHVAFRTLRAIFEDKVSIKAAAKEGSFALSDQLFVNRDKIWLYNQAIGTVTKAKEEYSVKLYDQVMFGTEVRDAFRRAEIGATVE